MTENQLAIVTGAASGIGRAIAIELACRGHLVVVADIDHKGSNETVSLISREGGTGAAMHVDISVPESVVELRNAVWEKFGAPTILVNNAGWDRGMPFLDTTADFWRKVVDINYLGAVSMCHAFLKDMITAEVHGHVVNIGSDAGRVGSMFETVYSGAKGAVIAFSKSLAREMARNGINVNCVCPGPTDTKLFYEADEKVRNAVLRSIPFKRLADPKEIASAVCFLASDESSYITGQVFSVSGGLTMAG